MKARIRPGSHKNSGSARMNATESRYAEVLEAKRLNGEILWWQFEPMRLRIGNNWKTTYTPDFMAVLPSGEIELVDVKGSGPWEEDARVKIKCASRLYPMFHWVAEKWRGQLQGFVREEIP